MDKQLFDLIVIGSGPGGYVAAIRGAQRGLKTALIEERELGGTCLNRGCIPSKTLIANAETLHKVREAHAYGIEVGKVSFDYAAMNKRKDDVVAKIRRGLDGLIASNQITVFSGYGRFISPTEVAVTGKDQAVLEGKSIIIATGSEPRELAQFPFDHEVILDSTSLLNLTKLPKKLVIIGGGVIGCEFACLHNAFDVDVTIIELLPSLISTEGQHVSSALTAAFKKRGIRIETSAVVEKIVKEKGGARVHLADGSVLDADQVLVCVGRKFNSSGIGLEKTGVITEESGSVPVNEKMQTNVPHIYAIGDVTGKWILAHVASHQGMIAADHIAGLSVEMRYNAVPSVIYTIPEIATIGLTLERAIEAGYDATLGKFPFQALGKSQATLETEGFAQVVSDKKTGEILGAQVVGHGASTLIAEMAVAIGSELTIHSIKETIHAHPTVAEAWLEAALAADETPLHMPPKKRAK